MAAGICALAAFGAAYGGSHYLVVGIEGLALGIAVAFTGTRLRQPAWLVIGEGVAVYFLLGPALVAPSAAVHGFLPGPSGLAVLGRMTIQGWSGLLSTSPVVGNFHFLLVVPYLCGLICGLATMLLAMRLPRYPLAAVPPVALLVVGILFGTDTDASRIVPGGALVVVLITWVTYTQRGRADIGGRSRAGYLLAGIMVLACGVAGVLIAPQVPGASAQPRYVLRDHISPPFNVDQYVSPLSVYRQYVDPEPSGLRKKVLFTVSGATPNTYLQLATMDAYNGIVFNVAGGSEGSSASGSFATVGQPVSGEACPIAAACRRQHITVHVRDYQNVWLPTAGIVRSITFEGKESAGLASAFRYNVSTNTAVVSDGLETGSVYSMVAEVPQLPPASKLKGAGIIQGVQPAPTDVPSVVHSVAVKVTSGAPSDFQKAENIAKFLRTKGAFSNGTGTEVASLPGHGAARIASFLESPQPIGDAEQYRGRHGIDGPVTWSASPSRPGRLFGQERNGERPRERCDCVGGHRHPGSGVVPVRPHTSQFIQGERADSPNTETHEPVSLSATSQRGRPATGDTRQHDRQGSPGLQAPVVRCVGRRGDQGRRRVAPHPLGADRSDSGNRLAQGST